MRDARDGWSARLLDLPRRQGQTDRALRDLETCSVQDVERMARDIGIDMMTLSALAARNARAADLLPGRLAGLGLDLDRLGYGEQGVARDLEGICGFCGQKRRCTRDLGTGGVPPHCPNADTVTVLLT